MATIIDSLRDALSEIGIDAALQVAASLVLFGAVLLLARLLHNGLGTDPVWAVGRGLMQVVVMGFLLATILALHAGWSLLVLLAMSAIAAGISDRRAGGTSGAYPIAFIGICLGTAVVVASMLAMGALQPRIRDLVPVGSIFIAMCMRTASLAFERYEREAEMASEAPGPVAVKASLIPAIDGMRSLGFVWIPGIMTGLILAGESPARAAFLQFVVVALGFVASAVTSLSATTWLAQRRPAGAS